MGTLSLAGALILSPDGSSTTFPGAETTIPLVATTSDYAVAVQSGLQAIASPSAYVTLAGIGANGTVTTAKALYLRSEDSITVRLTTSAGTAVVPVQGLLVLEFQDAALLTKVEVQGTSRIEFAAVGPA